MNKKILQAYVVDQLALLMVCIPIVEYKELLRAYEHREKGSRRLDFNSGKRTDVSVDTTLVQRHSVKARILVCIKSL